MRLIKMNQNDYCQAIGELVRTINTKTVKLTNQQYAQQNLTSQQINILLLLDSEQALRVSDIGKVLLMPDSNVSATCSRLERMGLIERFRQKEDQRVVNIQLTAAAQDRIGELKSMVLKFQDIVFKNVAEEDLKDIVRGLTKYNKLLNLALTSQNE